MTLCYQAWRPIVPFLEPIWCKLTTVSWNLSTDLHTCMHSGTIVPSTTNKSIIKQKGRFKGGLKRDDFLPSSFLFSSSSFLLLSQETIFYSLSCVTLQSCWISHCVLVSYSVFEKSFPLLVCSLCSINLQHVLSSEESRVFQPLKILSWHCWKVKAIT